jgi:hypothetical protein
MCVGDVCLVLSLTASGYAVPMLSLLVVSLLAAEPIVLVAPVEWRAGQKLRPELGLALQSVLEVDLRANGVSVRTEDDLDSKHWGKIEGARVALVATVIELGTVRSIAVRLVEIASPNVLAATKVPRLTERRNVTTMVLHALKKPAPVTLSQLEIDEGLFAAWGAALLALHDGSPEAARTQVAAVAAKWPQFTPARERLAQLEK